MQSQGGCDMKGKVANALTGSNLRLALSALALQLRMWSLGATAKPELLGTGIARLGHGTNRTVEQPLSKPCARLKD